MREIEKVKVLERECGMGCLENMTFGLNIWAAMLVPHVRKEEGNPFRTFNIIRSSYSDSKETGKHFTQHLRTSHQKEKDQVQ